MKNIILLFGLFLIFKIAFGQEIHTPAEILKIMEKSSVSYELHPLENEIKTPDRTNKLNYNHYYQIKKDGSTTTYKYELNEETTNYVKKAEQFFKDRKFKEAREMYIKALESDSTYYEVMTYIGQTYGIEKNWDKAIDWYKKTIKLNYIDYMAHWFLADAYKVKGELDLAVNEITIAQILNRNNPRLNKSLKEIYDLRKLNYNEWVFNPQVQIDSIGVNKVKIAFDANWLGYAMVKAVWLYEPGYKEKMGSENSLFSMLQEKEALVSLMTGLDKKSFKKIPEFKTLKLALNKKMIDEYIYYEILLPEHPFVAYQFPQEIIEDIKEYIINVRTKK
ncbi:MAG: tetratricopeptide repeat protein [Bacteroidota bacterium]